MIKVLLAEDHHLVRKGTKALLENMEDIIIVGEAANGREAVELTMKLKPDVVVMDVNMPLLNGIQATSEIARLGYHTQVIILSMFSDDALVREALSAGAQGFVLKNSLTEELVLAIRSAYLNETFLSARVSGSVRDYLKGREKPDSHDNPIQKLTPREREVMQLIAEGHSNKEIAEMLNISPKTVDKHRSSMMSKIGVHDVASVVRLAIKYKLIFIDE